MLFRINCGYDVEDETAHFGTRAVAVGSDCLFETSTLATIEPSPQDGEEIPEPDIKSALHLELGIIVAINNSLIIFSKDCSRVKSSLVFQSNIECFYASKNGSYVFVGLCDGVLQCFSIRTGQTIYTSKFAESSEQNRTFVAIVNDSTAADEELLIFFTSGAVYRMCSFVLPSESHKASLFNGTFYCLSFLDESENDSSPGSKLSDNTVLDSANSQQENLFIDTVVEKVEQFDFKVLSIFQVTANGWSPFVICGGNKYDFFSVEDDELYPASLDPETNLIKIAVIEPRYIICLSASKELIIVNPHTLMPINVWKERKIKDFVVFGDSDGDLIVLTDEEAPCLLMLSIPEFQIKLNFQLEEVGFLISGVSSGDDFLFINVTKNNNVIHIKTVMESMPEFRLDRLLKREKFDEAETFAKTFNLQMELVYKAKLRKLSQDLQPWTECQVPAEENFTQAMKLLHEIQDMEFVADFTFNIVLAHSNMFHHLLTYSKKRLQDHLLIRSDCERTKNLLSKIKAYSMRFDSFLLLDSELGDVDGWIEFSRANLLETCLLLVEQGELQKSLIIWSRHLHEISPHLDESQVRILFSGIPAPILIADALPWLNQVVPFILDKYPSVSTEFVNWYLLKIWELEQRKPAEWPAIGVKYLELVLNLIQNPRSLIPAEMKEYCWHSNTANSPVKKLIEVIKTLKEINDLNQNYKIYISTSEYYHDSAEEVVFVLLNRVPLDKINSLINVFLDKYFLEKQMNPDKIIARFTKMEIESSLLWWKPENIKKQTKIVQLIECVSCIEEKVGCLICLLNWASIPWSPSVINLADSLLETHPGNADLIRECYEMVPVKEILKKYDQQSILTTRRELLKCIKYIFNQGKEEADVKLKDALQLVKGHSSDLTMNPYFCYIEELLMLRKFEQVSKFFENQSNENVVVECCKYIIQMFPNQGSEDLFDVLDTVVKHLKKIHHESEKNNKFDVAGCASLFISKAIIFKNMFILKRDYGIAATQSQLLESKARKEIIRDCYAKIMKGVDKTEESLDVFKAEALKLGGLLNLPLEDIILSLGEFALSFKEFDLAAIILSLVTKNCQELSPESSTVALKLSSRLITFHLSVPHATFAGAIQVVKSLTVLGILGCKTFSLSEAMEIYSKSVLLHEFCSFPSSSDQNNALLPLYRDPVASVASAPFAVSFILNLFSYCSSFQDSSVAIESTFNRSQMDRSTRTLNASQMDRSFRNPEIVPEPVMNFRHTVQRFFGEQQDIKSLLMVCSVLWQCASSVFNSSKALSTTGHLPTVKNPLLDNAKIVDSCVSALLKKVLGSKHLDIQMAIYLLHSFPSANAIKWLGDFSKNCGTDCHRLKNVSLVGMEYCKKNSTVFHAERKQFQKTYLQCSWSERLSQFNLSTRDTFKQTEKEQKQLLLKLITLPDVTVELLIEYCEDFGFDPQEYLLLLVKHSVLAWEPEFEVKTDLIGKKTLIITNSTENLLKRCTEIATYLEESEELKSLLNSELWNEVNQYNYEIYLVIMDLLEVLTNESELHRKFKLIIFFLKSYQRLSPPGTFEEEFWDTKSSSSQPLPPIAEYRLPAQIIASSWFNTGADLWKVARPELTIESYKQWFDVMHILGMDKNSICTLAINQVSVSKKLEENPANTQWCVHVRHAKLLKDVRECIEHVTNLELASASLYQLVQRFPPGADQLAAIELCLRQARQWCESKPSVTSQTCLHKVEKKYLTIVTTHALYVNNLAKSEYLNLVLDPQELIKELYHDQSIVERMTNHALNDIDINGAAAAIAKLHSINLTNIRLQLLSHWLQPYNQMNETMVDETFAFSSKETPTSTIDENFIRACYILESDIETSVRYLVGLIFACDLDDIKPISVQFRALKCLFAIIPSAEQLEEVTARDLASLQSHLKSLMYLNELEKNGLVYSVEGFQSCNKVELIESLVSHKTCQSLRIAVKLCLDFDVNKLHIWRNIVSFSVGHLMIDELKIILPHLNGMFELTNSGEIIDAWNTLLLFLLEKIGPEDQVLIEEFQFYLNSCCIFPQLDVKKIENHCRRIDPTHLLPKVRRLMSFFIVNGN